MHWTIERCTSIGLEEERLGSLAVLKLGFGSMGSYYSLMAGKLEIDYGKNWIEPHLLAMFREGDQVSFEQVIDGDDKEEKRCYQTTAGVLGTRLDLLGFTMRRAFLAFEEGMAELRSDEFYDGEYEYSLAEWQDKVRALALGEVVPPSDPILAVIQDYDGEHPMLGFPAPDARLVYRSVCNCLPGDTAIVLDYSELAMNGWVEDEGLVEKALDDIADSYLSSQRILVLVEGSTDRRVLEKCLDVRYPDLRDFFIFLDVVGKGGGASNLVERISTFASIKLKMRVVALLDNDAVGMDALRCLSRIELPSSFHVTALPDLELAKDYPTVGPNGQANANINGKAASIEIYLGNALLGPNGHFPPVIWKGPVPGVGSYQGEIESKAKVLDRFFGFMDRIQAGELAVGDYDWSGLDAICQRLFKAFV